MTLLEDILDPLLNESAFHRGHVKQEGKHAFEFLLRAEDHVFVPEEVHRDFHVLCFLPPVVVVHIPCAHLFQDEAVESLLEGDVVVTVGLLVLSPSADLVEVGDDLVDGVSHTEERLASELREVARLS